MGRELIAELSAFEITYAPSGNLRGCARMRSVRDLVIATALALWSAVGRSSGRSETAKLQGYY